MEADALGGGGGRSLLGVAASALLLGGWTLWLVFARVAVQVDSTRARIEVEALAHPVQVEIAGRIRASRLSLGQQVRQGEVLIELDSEPTRLALQEAQARLAADQAVLERRTVLARSEAALVQRLAVAGRVAVDETAARARQAEIVARLSEADAVQWDALSRDGAAAGMEAARSRAAAEGQRTLAQAEAFASERVAADQATVLQQHQIRMDALGVELAELNVAIAADEAAVARLEAELAHCTVRAPADGRLGWIDTLPADRLVEEGHHAATVVPDGALRVVAWMPARQATGRVQVGQPALLALEAFPRAVYGALGATVTAVGSEPVDGQIRIEAALDDAPAAAPRRHGLEGTLSVTIERAAPLALLLRAMGRVGLEAP